jgi:hypothetical protein
MVRIGLRAVLLVAMLWGCSGSDSSGSPGGGDQGQMDVIGKGEGEDCKLGSWQCKSNLVCRGKLDETNQCLPRGGVSDPCVSAQGFSLDSNCRDGLVCDVFCKLPLGAMGCTDYSECAESCPTIGDCSFVSCVDGVCRIK